MFVIYLHTTFNLRSSSSSLVTALKPKTVCGGDCTRLPSCYFTVEKIPLCKKCEAFEDIFIHNCRTLDSLVLHLYRASVSSLRVRHIVFTDCRKLITMTLVRCLLQGAEYFLISLAYSIVEVRDMLRRFCGGISLFFFYFLL